MFWVYVIRNSEGVIYIGQTNDLAFRLLRHNGDRVKSTKNRGPWSTMFQRSFNSRSDAMAFERYLKRQKGGNGLRKILDRPLAPQ